ncbi:MAG: hypothetical protein P8J45_09180 [Phycisphaerales bacterium]|jgi:hypothetical protein|nr:hypothetical protein [Phycisphaerales bacterium]
MRTIAAGLVLLLLLLGCQRVVVPGPLPPHAGDAVQLNAGYGLLINLLEQEARVDGLLSIRTLPPSTTQLVKAIARDASVGAAELKSAKDDPPVINWDSEGLPVTEIEARNLIASQTSLKLLSTSGKAGELELLLSQLKATEYIAALSSSLLGRDRSEARRAVLKQVNEAFLQHHQALRVALEQGWDSD